MIALKVYLCPLKVAWHLPEGKCQTLMLLSHDPDTRMLLSRGLNAMELTMWLPVKFQLHHNGQPSTPYRRQPTPYWALGLYPKP